MAKEEQRFEEIVSNLEKIVNELDSSLGLEESLKKFEEGMALATLAEQRLKTIENQFQKIQQNFSKEAAVVPADELLSEEVVSDTVNS